MTGQFVLLAQVSRRDLRAAGRDRGREVCKGKVKMFCWDGEDK